MSGCKVPAWEEALVWKKLLSCNPAGDLRVRQLPPSLSQRPSAAFDWISRAGRQCHSDSTELMNPITLDLEPTDEARTALALLWSYTEFFFFFDCKWLFSTKNFKLIAVLFRETQRSFKGTIWLLLRESCSVIWSSQTDANIYLIRKYFSLSKF